MPNQNQRVRQIDATPPAVSDGLPTLAQPQDIYAMFRKMAASDPEGFACVGFGYNPQ